MDTNPQEDIMARRTRGAYFTPPALAQFIVRWAVRSSDDRVLEPSCGDARFLYLAAQRMREHASDNSHGLLEGVELHEQSARVAEVRLREASADATIHKCSFFEMAASAAHTAVVGNPPFLRFQEFGGESRAAARRQTLAAGVRLDGRSNAWAYFVVHAAGFVAPGGRLGLVLPADLLHAGYSAEVRSFLLGRFADVRILTFRKRVFPDADVNVIVLLAEGEGRASHFKVYEADGIEDLGRALDLQWRARSLVSDRKWTSALVGTDALQLYDAMVAADCFSELSASWGKASIGAVTGDADFFRMTATRLDTLGLTPDDTLRLFPGWRRSRSDITFTSAAWEAARARGEKVYLFYPEGELSNAAQRYIASGVEYAIDLLSGKCTNRDPWWRIPLAPLADLFVGNVSHHTPILMTNRARLHHTNAYYGINLTESNLRLGRDLLPLAALNSVSLLAAEIIGRSHGKGGLKLAVADVDAWPVPTSEHVRSVEDGLKKIRSRVRLLVQRGRVIEAAGLVDHVVLSSQSAEHLTIVRHELGLLRRRRADRGSYPARQEEAW